MPCRVSSERQPGRLLQIAIDVEPAHDVIHGFSLSSRRKSAFREQAPTLPFAMLFISPLRHAP